MNVLRRRSSSTPKKPSAKIVFKKFMEFLQTDVWRLPTMNFLEKNSILFNREQANHDLCVEAHQQYTALVDTLIESYCADIAISTKDLVEALKIKDQNSKLSEKEKRLLEPVVAAQDFNVFVPLMTRINIELQLQAVRLLEHICGVQTDAFKFSQDEMDMWQSVFDEDETERYVIISVLKQSKEEFEQDARLKDALRNALQSNANEIQMLEEKRNDEIALLDSAINGVGSMQIIELSSIDSAKTNVESKKPPRTPKPQVAEDKTMRRSSLKNDCNIANKTRAPMAPVKVPIKGGAETPTPENEIKLNEPNDKDLFDFRVRSNQIENNLMKDRADMPEELLKQRAQYLKQQRDKIVEAKHKQREQQLIEAAQRNASERPRTSQAARGALRGVKVGRLNPTSETDLLEARRAIADRIRNQVMGAGERSDAKP
ncbi:Cilia- and flagella-associated protein 36 [Aphelenchoides besseyi]|nr:Cilia- and flagella-associated protein 36 [Aphelenchoides besseyi]KAI6200260.1 Cilia- and flagella-associated protein 36 [Aphelenchoides besseyi]